MTCTRLAPSPTGAQHLGNARTHLAIFWAARRFGHELVWRIDDLDSPRVKPWAIDQARDDLKWLGILPDQEPVLQSRHSERYAVAIDALRGASNLAYPCYCSRKEIAEAQSAPHESRFFGEPAVYPGTCSGYRHGDPIRGLKHCWRFRTTDQTMHFDDLVMRRQTCSPATDLGDFPITTKESQATYQLAVVIDDHIQGVDLVIRGNDLIASSFRQIELCQHLELPVPQYAHLPLVRGQDGRRLAKRHGDTRLSYYRDQGVAAEQIIGWAAFSLGLIDQNTPCEAEDLTSHFEWSKIDHRDTYIDPRKVFA